MRRFYISEMDRRALRLAKKLGLGLETIDFCRPENMENAGVLRAKEEQFSGIDYVSLHAPYYELAPCAIDPMIRDVAMHRFSQAIETCQKLGIRRMIVHSGYAPQMYFPQWFVPKSIEFWKEFAQKLPEGFELLLENVLDVKAEYLRDVCDGVSDERVRICLDVGHANAYSPVPVEEWIETFANRIAHVHLHNNYGERDEHNVLNNGSMNMDSVLLKLKEHAPDADICIESMDAEGCIRWLKEKGYINAESL